MLTCHFIKLLANVLGGKNCCKVLYYIYSILCKLLKSWKMSLFGKFGKLIISSLNL